MQKHRRILPASRFASGSLISGEDSSPGPGLGTGLMETPKADPQAEVAAVTRLDRLLSAQGYFTSREKAAYAIRAGGVRVDGRTVIKPAARVSAAACIQVNKQNSLRIGRGERKLAGILEHFGIDCAGKIALDVGSSAGGFTWQLLQHGAKRVYAVDVGANQLHPELRVDPRVMTFERTDIRDLDSLPERPAIAAIDVSFISLRLVVPHVCTLMAKNADIVALLKPQFEGSGPGTMNVTRIRGQATQRPICEAFSAWCRAHRIAVQGAVECPLPGKHGDREIFFHLQPEAAATEAAE